MTLNNEKSQPIRRAMFGNQSNFSGDPADPSKPRQQTQGIKLGNFARSLMAQAQSENSCLSPNTIQNLVNPMRSQLGLPKLALYTTPPEPEKKEEKELPSSLDKKETKKSDSDGEAPVIGRGNDILNISFTAEDECKPNYCDSFNMNDQSGMAGLTSFGLPSQIQDDTRSFALPNNKTGDDLSNWSLRFGGGDPDRDRSYDVHKPENKSYAESEDNNNESQDSFMLNRRNMAYDDSIDGIHNHFDKLSLLATERSRCTATPDRSGNIWGMTRAFSTPELSSKKIAIDPSECFSYAEDKYDLSKPFTDHPISPAFTKPVGVSVQNPSIKANLNITQIKSRDTTYNCEPQYHPSGYGLQSSRHNQNTFNYHPRKLSKVDEVSSPETFTSEPNTVHQLSRHFGRYLESENDAREMSREIQNNQGANFTFNKPTPLKPTTPYSQMSEKTPGASINNDNNSVNIPEIAARIPTGSRGSGDGKKDGKSHKSGTPAGRPTKPLLNPPSSSGKHKLIPKEKKPSGWKFSSEHVNNKEYLTIKSLGKGGCGEVFLVIEKESRELYALKKVSLAGIDEESVQECVNEVQLLGDLKDSDLVVHICSWEFDKSEKTMKIVMEHGQCDLNSSVRTVNSSILKLKSIWERILIIVDFIHKRGIVHADLKPANFIWAGDNLKIIDFGIASRLQQDHTSIPMLCPKGTLNYISPETIQPDAMGRAKIGPKSDIWSLGCILYLMVFGRTPFEHISHPAAKMNAIVKGDIPYPPLPPHLQSSAPELLSVLRSCFQVDYKMRPTTAELLRHPFLRKM